MHVKDKIMGKTVPVWLINIRKFMKILGRNESFLILRHEGVWANRIIDPLILDLYTRQSGQLHVPADLRSENNAGTNCIRVWVGLIAGLTFRRIFFLPEIELWIIQRLT